MVQRNNNLIANRIRNKLTQSEIAKKANISTRYYQSIEAGNSKPNVVIAIKLANILNEDVTQLFAVVDDN